MYECFILICQKKWFGDTETFCFNITKTKYFDFLFWNKFCCLKTDLNFRKGFFKPALCNKNQSISFPFEENAWVYSFSPCSWIWQQNWKIHIHLPFSLLILTSHLQLLKESNAFNPSTHHCHYSTSLLSLCKKGAAKMEFCLCPKAWWHPRYVWPRVTRSPRHRTWTCLSAPWSRLPSSPTAPGLARYQMLCPYQGFI